LPAHDQHTNNENKIQTKEFNMRFLPIATLTAATMLVGCASNPNNIDAIYVTPLKYATYSCNQIAQEMGYVEQRTNVLYQNLQRKRTNDNWAMGVGMVLFWPALFALDGGDGPEATEYAQIKGEYEALRQNSVDKSCNITMQSPDDILNSAQQADREQPTTQSSAAEAGSISARLRELEQLHKDGLLSDEEYNAARQRVLMQ
jgi:hypothetical protein